MPRTVNRKSGYYFPRHVVKWAFALHLIDNSYHMCSFLNQLLYIRSRKSFDEQQSFFVYGCHFPCFISSVRFVINAARTSQIYYHSLPPWSSNDFFRYKTHFTNNDSYVCVCAQSLLRSILIKQQWQWSFYASILLLIKFTYFRHICTSVYGVAEK